MRRVCLKHVIGCVLLATAGAATAQPSTPGCINGELRVELQENESASFTKLSCEAVHLSLRGRARLEIGLVLANSVSVDGAHQSALKVQVMSTGGLRMELTDSAQATIHDGHASHLALRNTGAGVADLEGMGSRTASVDLLTSGIAHVDAHRELAGLVSGASSLHSKGTPALVHVDVTGTGRYWTGPRP